MYRSYYRSLAGAYKNPYQYCKLHKLDFISTNCYYIIAFKRHLIIVDALRDYQGQVGL